MHKVFSFALKHIFHTEPNVFVKQRGRNNPLLLLQILFLVLCLLCYDEPW